MSNMSHGRILNRQRDIHHIGIETDLDYTLPESGMQDSDLAPLCPPIYDQGQFGSCTANAWMGLFEFLQLKGLRSEKPTAEEFSRVDYTPGSRAMFYDCERIQDGDFNQDAGSSLATGSWVVSNIGVCPESLYPYLPIDLTRKPPDLAYATAGKHIIHNVHLIPDNDTSTVIARLKLGYPVVIGISVYASFFAAVNGVVPYPDTFNEEFEGGHAICLVGYNEEKQLFKFRNSWGTSWGDAGHGYLSLDYLANVDLASDFHTANL